MCSERMIVIYLDDVDISSYFLQWRIPKPIDNVIVLVESGCNSVEKQVQMKREQGVLCALFFNK